MILSYQGFFRLPSIFEGPRFAYGAQVIAYNPKRNSLYVSAHTEYPNLVAEVSIPQLKNRSHLLHGFVDVSDGKAPKHWNALENKWDEFRLGGMLVDGEKLHWNYFKYYNVDETDHAHLGVSNNDLSNLNSKGPYRLGRQHIQRCGGYISRVPSTWRTLFGYPFITGLCRAQGRASSSNGPAIFGYNPEDTTKGKGFLFYPLENKVTFKLQTIDSEWVTQSWKGVDEFHGFIFEDTALVAAVLLARTTTDDYGEHGSNYLSCQDGIQGFHGKYFVPELWLYNPNRILDAATGKIKSYAPRPRQRINLSKYWINQGACRQMGEMTYDQKTKRIFLVEPDGDKTNSAEYAPVIHVFNHS